MPAKPKKPIAATIEGLDTAPMIFFDEAPLCGITGGICRMTLTSRYDGLSPEAAGIRKSRAVAHVQFPLQAVGNLRRMLDAIEDIANRGKGTVN